MLLILDEAKNLSEAYVQSALMMIAGDKDAAVLATSTPKGRMGPFFKFFTSSRWQTATISAWDIPRLRESAQEALDDYGPTNSFYLQQVCAQFADTDDQESVLPIGGILAAIQRPPFEPSPWQGWPLQMGLDPAGKRGFSVAVLRRGPNVLPPIVVGHGIETMEMLGRAVNLIEKHRVQSVTVDSAGFGAAIADRLREVYDDPTRRRVQIMGLNAATRANNHEQFFNIKSEILYDLRRMLIDGTIKLPDDPELIGQLSGYQQTIMSNGRVRTIDPDPSPDRGDALLLSLYGGIAGLDPLATGGEVATGTPAFMTY